jgi:Rps23 Pro-64 3,4-dihydroxylase Tpa1-like proline 4-hydroxylase
MAVSYIIYLTDPDEEWTEEDGGALELYPLAEKGNLGVPANAPTKVSTRVKDPPVHRIGPH